MFLGVSLLKSFGMLIISFVIQLILMGYISHEAYKNVTEDSLIWINGHGVFYFSMFTVTFLLIDIDLRSGVELLTYSHMFFWYNPRLLIFNPFSGQYA